MADVLSAAVAVLLPVAIVGDDSLRIWFLCALPLVIVVSKVVGLYDREALVLRSSTLEEAPRLFEVATLYALLFWLLSAVFVDGSIGRDQLLGVWVLLFVCMVLSRATSRRIARALTSVERCLVIGDRYGAERLRLKLGMSRHTKAAVTGRVPIRYGHRRGEDRLGESAPGDVPVLGDLGNIGSVIARNEIDRVVITPSVSDSEHAIATIKLVQLLGVKVSLMPRLREAIGTFAVVDDVDGLTLLGLPRFGLSRSSAFLKRSMDLAGSILGLIVLAPFLLAIALAIKATSAGPVIFRQRRIGRDGTGFWVRKFRTMCVDAEQRKDGLAALSEADGFFKISDDPRITRVGRLLRGASLDELPQLINVLRGEMSLVGPRPFIPEEDCEVKGSNRGRLRVRPGMTGHWQILGASAVPFEEMVRIDYLYAENWSLWTDIKILMRTLPIMVARRGV